MIVPRCSRPLCQITASGGGQSCGTGSGGADPDAELALIDGEQTSSDTGSREDSATE